MKIKALVIRIFKQTIHDKRTLALMMVAPLIILSLIYFLFNSDDDIVLNVGVYNTSSEFNDGLKDADLNVLNYSNDDNIKDKIVDDELSAFIYTDGDELNITYENSSPQDTQKMGAIVKSVSMKNNSSNISSVISAKMPNLKSNISSGVSIVDSYVYGDSDTSYFDTINPMLIGFFVFFFVFLVAGISLLKERTSGTLDKLLSTPIKRSEILIGYLLGYGVFAVIQTIIVVLFAIYVLDMHIVGSAKVQAIIANDFNRIPTLDSALADSPEWMAKEYKAMDVDWSVIGKNQSTWIEKWETDIIDNNKTIK